MADEKQLTNNSLRIRIAKFVEAEASGPWGILGAVMVLGLIGLLAYAPALGDFLSRMTAKVTP